MYGHGRQIRPYRRNTAILFPLCAFEVVTRGISDFVIIPALLISISRRRLPNARQSGDADAATRDAFSLCRHFIILRRYAAARASYIIHYFTMLRVLHYA